MISLITISLCSATTFDVPGVGVVDASHGPVPSGRRERGDLFATTASRTLLCPGE